MCPSAPDPAAARLGAGDPDLRRRTARGTIVNAAFLVALNGLGLLRGFVVATFLSSRDYGLWGILLAALALLVGLKDVGIGDKYVQQDEEDQEKAFQQAFTLELIVSGAFTALVMAASPLVAAIYGEPRLIIPGIVLALAIPTAAFQAPIWVFYRRMDFVRQRLLQSVNPLVAFALTIGLAIAGFGYWSLVIGTLAGFWAGAAAAALAAPYRLRIRFDRGAMRIYARFSGPVFIAALSTLVMAQVATLTSRWTIGLAAVGAMSLASSITQYTHRVDAIVTQTLYPAVCAVAARRDLMREAFTKSNRLTLMWGMPFGIAVALFTPDLIHDLLGDRWDHAILLIQVTGLVAAVNHIAFNWDAFVRAKGETGPLGRYGLLALGSFVVLALPPLVVWGLSGYAAGIGAQAIVLLAGRAYVLRRLLGSFDVIAHSARAIAPTIPAAGAVLLARAVESGHRGLGTAVVELAAFGVVTLAATVLFERKLVREVLGYLRRRGAQSPFAVSPA